MSESPAKVRLVRCPKCSNLLPEVTDYAVYQCGGCGAVLRGGQSMSSYKSVASNTSEDREEEVKINIILDNNPADVAVNANEKPKSPASGSPLQDHFDYSTKYNRAGKGNVSRRSEMEQAAFPVNLGTDGSFMKDAAVASEIDISSQDYDNFGNYDFESMDKLPIGGQSMTSCKSVASNTSEDREEEVKINIILDNNPADVAVNANIKPTPPASGSPLQDYFDYSTIYNRAGKGNMSRRSEMEQAAFPVNLGTDGSSMKDAAEASEMTDHRMYHHPSCSCMICYNKHQQAPPPLPPPPVLQNDIVNTGTSQESGDANREPERQRNSGGNDSFFKGMIKKSFREFSKSTQHADQGKVNVTVNGHPIVDRLVKKAEKLAGPIEPGDYWYDTRAGFWGIMGGPCRGIIPPFIEEFNYPMPKKCADGNTNVFVNGRELHHRDLDLLASRGLPTDTDRSYVIEISGTVLDEYSGQELEGLGKLAPTLERKNYGLGMKPPKYNRAGKGNVSGRSEMEQAAFSVNLGTDGSSMKDAAVASEMTDHRMYHHPSCSCVICYNKHQQAPPPLPPPPVLQNDIVNTGTSQESGDANREPERQRNSGGNDLFFKGMIKKSFREFSKSTQHADQGTVNVTVNGHPILNRFVKRAENLAGPIEAGDYWYDTRAGFWGIMGGPCRGIIPPFIEEFNYPMPEKCADGNTNVFVNGRELHQRDLDLLASRGLPTDTDRSYVIEISGRVLDEDSGQELEGLGKLAPTVERKKHGFGMKPPRTIAV